MNDVQIKISWAGTKRRRLVDALTIVFKIDNVTGEQSDFLDALSNSKDGAERSALEAELNQNPAYKAASNSIEKVVFDKDKPYKPSLELEKTKRVKAETLVTTKTEAAVALAAEKAEADTKLNEKDNELRAMTAKLTEAEKKLTATKTALYQARANSGAANPDQADTLRRWRGERWSQNRVG